MRRAFSAAGGACGPRVNAEPETFEYAWPPRAIVAGARSRRTPAASRCTTRDGRSSSSAAGSRQPRTTKLSDSPKFSSHRRKPSMYRTRPDHRRPRLHPAAVPTLTRSAGPEGRARLPMSTRGSGETAGGIGVSLGSERAMSSSSRGPVAARASRWGGRGRPLQGEGTGSGLPRSLVDLGAGEHAAGDGGGCS